MITIEPGEQPSRSVRAVVALTVAGVAGTVALQLLPSDFSPVGYKTNWSNLPGTYGHVSTLISLFASISIPLIALWFATRTHPIAGGGGLIAFGVVSLVRSVSFLFLEVGFAKAYGAPQNTHLPGIGRVFLVAGATLLASSAITAAGVMAIRGARSAVTQGITPVPPVPGERTPEPPTRADI